MYIPIGLTNISVACGNGYVMIRLALPFFHPVALYDTQDLYLFAFSYDKAGTRQAVHSAWLSGNIALLVV